MNTLGVSSLFAAALGNARSLFKPTVKFTAAQVLKLPRSNLKLGPLLLKDWHQELNDFFVLAHSRSPHFSIYGLNNLGTFLQATTSKTNGQNKVRNDVVYSLQLQFFGRFFAMMRPKISGLSPAEADALSTVFMELKDLQLTLLDRQAHREPFNGLIRTSNEHLAKYNQKLPFNVKVVP